MGARGWFEVRSFPDGVIGIGEPGHAENVKSYLIPGRDLALLFDTGMGVGDIRSVVEAWVRTPVLVVNSHSHWDHIGDDWRFDRVWIHEAEAERLPRGVPRARLARALAPEYLHRPLPPGVDPTTFAIPGVVPERALRGGESIDLGDRGLTVLHTPGHSAGGITLVDERAGIALIGDAVYRGAMYAHIDDADPAVYLQTLRRLADLAVYLQTLRRLADLAPSLRAVYPSHDDYPLAPTFLTAARDALEEIWGGRAADEVAGGVERHRFDGFSFLLREGWRGRVVG